MKRAASSPACDAANIIARIDHAAERRDVEGLGRHQFLAPAQRTAIVVCQQVAVLLAEGVVDLADDRAQCAVGALAQPEAHRVEHVAQDARERVQPDLAGGVADAGPGQQFFDPDEHRPAIAMVGVVQREQPRAVHPQRTQVQRPPRERAQRQSQKEAAVGEAVGGRSQPRVADRAEADLGKGCHDIRDQSVTIRTEKSHVGKPLLAVVAGRPLAGVAEPGRARSGRQALGLTIHSTQRFGDSES
jgi:hypothetical protein